MSGAVLPVSRLSGSRNSGGPASAGSGQSANRPKLAPFRLWRFPIRLSPRAARVARISANLVGAGGAALFALASLRFYLQTHRLIGAAFLVEQTWVVVAYLVRRPARAVTRRLGDWLLAFGGTFGGVLFRPVGAHPHWGVEAGLGVQVLGLAICVASFVALGRSFGFAAADRGLVRRGPYAVVRHPIYASYLLLQAGYLLQSISVQNAFVMLFVTGCNAGRALVEDRMLATSEQYARYRTQVRWRLLPGVW
ncbi:MAG: methyltransferase family protein [Pseudonocardiaceae bacterium]